MDPDDNDALPQDDEVEGQDAGLDDDEGGDQTSDESSQEGSDEAEEGLEQRPSRATRAVQAAKQAAREANERAARVEAELQTLRQERQQRQQPQEETDEQFNARLSLMTVEERLDAKLQRAERRHQRELAVATFRTADAADRASYDAQAAYDPRFKKYAPQVEQALSQARAQGNWGLDRKTVLAYVIGQTVLANKEKVSQAKQQGQDNIRRQQARTNGGRSDQAAPQRRRSFAADDMSIQALESRLNGVFI